ncbi:glycosyltransferase family 4 protein [Paenibacillus sp. SI8]|uniref:glycosyltransferase family 4 protein n=1 Tax=unclassified Paenibacillus TaxID=185978 RepID=UPI0034676BB0
MNILFAFYIPSGGVETLNRLRSIALNKYGHQCHSLYLNGGSGLQNRHDMPVFVTNNDIEIKQLLDAGNYDVIVVTSAYRFLAKFRALGFHGKLIYEIQGLGSFEQARATLTEATHNVITYADGLLNPSTPHIMKLFTEFFPNMPQFNFNNCMDTEAFSYHPCPVSLHPIAAWVGRIEDNKNWSEFLHICHQLIIHHIPRLNIWMFEDPLLSEPAERARFEELKSTLNLADHIRNLNNIPHEQMPEYFSRIGDSGGFLCSTSKVEGAPYSVLEAMSCRCPVLTTDSDGVKSSILHNQTGKYYTAGNIGEAVNQAFELMTHPSLRQSICIQAEQHVKYHFSPKSYSENFLTMIHSLP